jgi:hypothetical protein
MISLFDPRWATGPALSARCFSLSVPPPRRFCWGRPGRASGGGEANAVAEPLATRAFNMAAQRVVIRDLR